MGNELSKYDSDLNLVKQVKNKIRLVKLAKNDDATPQHDDGRAIELEIEKILLLHLKQEAYTFL